MTRDRRTDIGYPDERSGPTCDRLRKDQWACQSFARTMLVSVAQASSQSGERPNEHEGAVDQFQPSRQTELRIVVGSLVCFVVPLPTIATKARRRASVCWRCFSAVARRRDDLTRRVRGAAGSWCRARTFSLLGRALWPGFRNDGGRRWESADMLPLRPSRPPML